MEPLVARAFLIGIIRKANKPYLIDLIRGYEKRALPPGRYLAASELCDYLKMIGKKNPQNRVELVNPSDEDINLMEKLYWRWATRDLVIANQFEAEHPEVEHRTRLEEIHAWEDFACQEVGL